MADAGTQRSRWWWTLVGIGAATTFLLSVANVHLHQRSLALQQDVAERQATINEGVRLGQFNNQLIQALANLAAQTHDEQIRQVLADHGVTYSVNSPPETVPSAGTGKSTHSG